MGGVAGIAQDGRLGAAAESGGIAAGEFRTQRVGGAFIEYGSATLGLIEKRNIAMTESNDDFQIEWHGSCIVIIPASNVETLRWDLIEQAADIVMAPLKKIDVPMIVFDLSQVQFFGSVFLSLLLRCHKYVKSRGGELVLCGASTMARELLSVTALDTLWAIYDSRKEALDAVSI